MQIDWESFVEKIIPGKLREQNVHFDKMYVSGGSHGERKSPNISGRWPPSLRSAGSRAPSAGSCCFVCVQAQEVTSPWPQSFPIFQTGLLLLTSASLCNVTEPLGKHR